MGEDPKGRDILKEITRAVRDYAGLRISIEHLSRSRDQRPDTLIKGIEATTEGIKTLGRIHDLVEEYATYRVDFAFDGDPTYRRLGDEPDPRVAGEGDQHWGDPLKGLGSFTAQERAADPFLDAVTNAEALLRGMDDEDGNPTYREATIFPKPSAEERLAEVEHSIAKFAKDIKKLKRARE